MSEGWWYSSNGQRNGPVDVAALQQLMLSGDLRDDSLVWREGMAEWTALARVPELASVKHLVPPDLPRPTVRDTVIALPLAGRWRRFFARAIDMWTISLLVGLPIGYLGAQASIEFSLWLQRPGSDYLLTWLMMPIILFIEALVFGATGSTLGKSLVGVRVITVGGGRPSFAEYLKRQLGVYWYGLGTGFAVVPLFTMARQSGHLSAGRPATYDAGQFSVKAAKIGVVRSAVAVGAVVTLLVVNGALQQMSRNADQALVRSQHWTNEVTGVGVELPSGWVHNVQKNETGDTVHVFSAPVHKVVAVFAKEDIRNELSLEDYSAMWREAVARSMTVYPAGVTTLNSRPVWQGRGRMAEDQTRQVVVFLVQRGQQVWRVVLIGVDGAAPNSPEALGLRNALFSTL